MLNLAYSCHPPMLLMFFFGRFQTTSVSFLCKLNSSHSMSSSSISIQLSLTISLWLLQFSFLFVSVFVDIYQPYYWLFSFLTGTSLPSSSESFCPSSFISFQTTSSILCLIFFHLSFTSFPIDVSE